MKKSDESRRRFLGRLAGAGVAAAVAPTLMAAGLPSVARRRPGNRPLPQENRLILCVFSKHLQFLDYEPMAAAAAEIGFEGVDLTVRPDGHVLPENAAADLPRAVAAVRAAGLVVPTITTSITSVEEPHTRTILETAAELGIPGYRTGYLHYDPSLGVAGTIEALKPRMAALAALNEELGIHGDYQNHDGDYLGAPLWDLAMLFEDLEPAWMGVQYDIRHATVEGTHSWPLALDLLAPRVHSLVVKDFRWSSAEGQPVIENVPLGKGAVDFGAYWERIKSLQLRRPVSVHFEYPMPGHTEPLSSEVLRSSTIEVMQRDLTMLRKMLVQAGLG